MLFITYFIVIINITHYCCAFYCHYCHYYLLLVDIYYWFSISLVIFHDTHYFRRHCFHCFRHIIDYAMPCHMPLLIGHYDWHYFIWHIFTHILIFISPPLLLADLQLFTHYDAIFAITLLRLPLIVVIAFHCHISFYYCLFTSSLFSHYGFNIGWLLLPHIRLRHCFLILLLLLRCHFILALMPLIYYYTHITPFFVILYWHYCCQYFLYCHIYQWFSSIIDYCFDIDTCLFAILFTDIATLAFITHYYTDTYFIVIAIIIICWLLATTPLAMPLLPLLFSGYFHIDSCCLCFHMPLRRLLLISLSFRHYDY